MGFDCGFERIMGMIMKGVNWKVMKKKKKKEGEREFWY